MRGIVRHQWGQTTPCVAPERSPSSPLSRAGVVLKSGEELSADLVVDCSGRSSSMAAWLQAAGFTEPPLEEITAGIAYGSRTYAMPPGWFQQNVRRPDTICMPHFLDALSPES